MEDGLAEKKMNHNKCAKKYCIILLLLYMLITISCAIMVFIIDPFVHYRYPTLALDYEFGSPAYDTYWPDGYAKNMAYSGVIVGTSQSINFKCKQAEELFSAHFIRLSTQGGTYRDIARTMETALENNSDLKYVIRPLDENYLILDKNVLRNNEDEYPWFLYDDTYINDIGYLLNIDSFLCCFEMLMNKFIDSNVKTKSFDDYFISEDPEWEMSIYNANENSNSVINDVDKDLMIENLRANVITPALEHPETDFYYFFPPYSAEVWCGYGDDVYKRLQAQFLAIDILTQIDNIHLYSFYTVPNLIDSRGNFANVGHYNEKTAANILNWIYNGEYLITAANKEEYKKEVLDTFRNMNIL